jgi:hypothetical protein
MIINGLIGEHIATGYPVEIPLNSKEMQLAMYNEDGNIMNWCWEQMCDSVMHREGIEIIGAIDIDYIVINGEKKRFH